MSWFHIHIGISLSAPPTPTPPHPTTTTTTTTTTPHPPPPPPPTHTHTPHTPLTPHPTPPSHPNSYLTYYTFRRNKFLRWYGHHSTILLVFWNAFFLMKITVFWFGCLINNKTSIGWDDDLALTHWGRATHICVYKLTIIGSDNGLSPGRRQAIIWTIVGILLIGPLGTNFSEILVEIYIFSFKKMHLKVSSGKWRPFVSASMC